MKNLETGKLYIKDLFNKSKFYRIPEYQRPYVWGTEQIHDLLNDISSAMDSDSEKEYFLGCMIWNVVEERSLGYRFDCQDILDGQQRFITLFLLHAMLRDLSSDQNLGNKVTQRLKQEEDRYDNVPERHRVMFAIRKDKSFLDEWVLAPGKTGSIDNLRHISKDESRSVSTRGMAAALVDMQVWWEQKLDELEENTRQPYISDFFSYLSNRVLMLFLATPDNLDDAYNLFTVLNSRGLQLRAADILRAQNLRHIGDESKRKDYATLWDKYTDYIRSPLSSFDELLKYIALAKVRFTSDKTKSLNHAFEYLVERGAVTKGEGFFDLVGQYAKHFEAVSTTKLDIQESHKTNFENLYFILSETTGSLFVMPLLHYRELFGDSMIVEFLVKLDNLISMAWLLGKRTLKQRMFLLIRRMDELVVQDGTVAERAARFLSDPVLEYHYQYQTSKTNMDIEEFISLLSDEPWGSYGGSRLNKSRYLLLKLDLLYGSSQTRIAFNRGVSSVEHIMPRNQNKVGYTYNPIEHEKWLHRLGNIVLLDKKKNSSLSNSGYSVKRQKYQQYFESRPYTNSVFFAHDSWDIEALVKQHKLAVRTLADYYITNSLGGLESIRARR